MRSTFISKFCVAVLMICVLVAIKAGVAVADNDCLSVPNTYDDTSGSLSYLGSWTHGTNWPKACNTTISWSNTVGNNVSFSFNGSSITRLYSMVWNRGSETVYIDGVSQGTTSSYAATRRWQVAKTWQVSPGAHTIQMNVAGGGYSDIDAFVVDIPYVESGTYDDPNPQLKYTGTWTHGTGWSSAYGGTESWSKTSEDSVTFTFMGDQISYVYEKTFNRGKAAITIDGVDKGMFDLYSATPQWQSVINFSNIGSGIHTVHISVSGQKNPSSSDYYVDVDAFIIPTTSRYMTTVDPSTLYSQGCAQGAAGHSGAIVLDFGQPWYQNGSYGTLTFDANFTFRSTNDIKSAVENFLSGYYQCSPSNAFGRVAVGLNNYQGQTNNAHGQAWAQMVNDINTWILQPPSYADKEEIDGAMDIEPSYNTATNTNAWVDGYNSQTTRPMYDFGSCDGCPTSSCPNCTPNNGWTLDNIWYVAWGASADWPLPEIYRTDGVTADQWYRMSLFSYLNHSGRMIIKGAFTQFQACQTNGPCPGIDNTPGAGWTQLYKYLNGDSRTAQGLDWATDITWQN